MLAPILSTKLYIPPPRDSVVLRSRLIERLNEGLHRKLTLVSAPAGFGKTTLLSEWIAAYQGSVAWLSLDEGDNDLARFWSHFIAALQTFASNIGERGLGALQSPQAPPIESIMASLINEIASVPDDFIFILDDYHLVDSKQIDHALTFLIERLPPQMHLVMATREDPDLPLARWRARDQLVELRVKDLRFTTSEAAGFLNQTMGLHLSTKDIAALEARAEGWIAGLQLAALSMQGLQDTTGFIQSFTGSHHFVLDYLLEEVLHKQPPNIQTFLLQTSILDRLCGQLCDAVLLNSSIAGQAILEYLERANLFIVPLDNDRHWYRYHQLFAELLRNRLARTYPDQIDELHRRASDWCGQHDLPNESIRHALAIQDWSRAAEIIERFSDQWPVRGERRTLLGWLESFPVNILNERVNLGLTYAWTLFMANQLDRAEQYLNQLSPIVQATPAWLGELFVIRVQIAASRYDMPAVIDLAQQALTLLPPAEASPRSRILLSLGAAYDALGDDIAAAQSAFREAFDLGTAIAPANSVGGAPLPLTALSYLADIECLQGNLRNATRMYEQAVELAEQWNGQSSLALCLAQRGRATVFYEWNDLAEAERAAQESLRIGELWKSPYMLVPAYGLLSLINLARGQVDAAREVLRRAEQTTRELYSSPSDLDSLAFYQLLLWIDQNDFPSIERWEQQYKSDRRSQTDRGRNNLAVVLARAHIARYYRQQDDSALKQARALIEPALEQAQSSGLMLNAVRLLALEALARYAQGETAATITTLKRALTLAKPENYARSFLDPGKPMQELLGWSLDSQALSEPQLRVYVSKLIDHFGAAVPIGPGQPIGNAPIEPLTDRELEVLRLIAQGLSNREIGERLFLALSTVKGYNRIIFDKLQAQSRTEAIAHARELGLL